MMIQGVTERQNSPSLLLRSKAKRGYGNPIIKLKKNDTYPHFAFVPVDVCLHK